MIRKLISPSTDFLILTEIRADQRAILNTKIKYDLKPSHFSASQRLRGGVLICANQTHKKMEGSKRQSETPGHIAAAVYEIKKSRTVVLGIYGISESNDRLSSNLIREASNIIVELKLLSNTQHVLAAGDFNAILEPEDSSSREIRKKVTSAAFDHTFLSATLSPAKTTHIPPMKDYIIGSDEFLTRAINEMQEHVLSTSHPKRPPVNEEEMEATINGPLYENRDFDNNDTGQTSLHSFNTLIKKLHTLHDEISKRKKNENNLKIRNISNSPRNLKHELKRTRDPEAKIEINNRLEEIQRTLATETEAREKAAKMRINNFYKTGTGKMNPETFYCIKEKQPNREISSLEVDGAVITDSEEIIRVMQEWYETTAQYTTTQTTPLQQFMEEHNVVLPQITEDQKEMLSEKFSQDEIGDAIKEAKEHSAPGPSGQIISFYKILFMPNLMTEAINQMVFVPG